MPQLMAGTGRLPVRTREFRIGSDHRGADFRPHNKFALRRARQGRHCNLHRDGFYTLPLPPPGQYELEVNAPGFQAKAQFEIPLGVASSLGLDFALRPLMNLQEPIPPRAIMMPGGRSLLNFYGPDVDPNYWTTYSLNPGDPGKLEVGISDAVQPADIQALPLEGNNIYSILLFSNFFLDGVESNFYLVGGGGAAGYVANAITRGGGPAWHGQAYFNPENEILNANGFQANAFGLSRLPSGEDRVGYFVGGPLRRNLRARDRESATTVFLPNEQFLSFAGCPAYPSIACRLLTNYPVPPSTAFDPFVAPVTMDYSSRNGIVRGTLRAAISHLSEPDFIWSPYADYVSGLTQPVVSLATNWAFSLSPGVVNQFTAGWDDETVSWDRAHNENRNVIEIAPVLPGTPHYATLAYFVLKYSPKFSRNSMKAKALLLIVFLAGSANAQTRRALLVGIDHYIRPGTSAAPALSAKTKERLAKVQGRPSRTQISDLEGAVNDALQLRDLLIKKYKFDPKNVVLLKDSEATADRILDTLQTHLVDAAKPGDVSFFYYAGHGSRIKNTLTKNSSGMDSTIVPADTLLGVPDIRSKELDRIYLQARAPNKDVQLTVVQDSCFSGAGTRGVRLANRARAVDSDDKVSVAEALDGPLPEERGVLFFSASQDYQPAQELDDDRMGKHGAFTWAFLQVLATAGENERVDRIFQRTRALMQSKVNDQEPVALESGGRNALPLFGNDADPFGAASAAVGFVQPEHGMLELNSGVAMGPGAWLGTQTDQSAEPAGEDQNH